jgi:hypothetical protein
LSKVQCSLISEFINKPGTVLRERHNQIDHILIVRRGVQVYLMSSLSEGLIDTERFDVKKLNEGGVKEQYHVTTRNKFAALENLEDSGASTGYGTVLERTPKFRPKRV